MVVLEEYERAKKRGAPIYGEILGYGTTADAFRITDTHPEGRGAITCMKMALKDAGKNLDEIHYINAHGTSTQVNDRVETLAIKEVFGDQAYKIPGLEHQEHDGPPHRGGRRDGADHLADGDPRRRGPADDQLRNARPAVRPRLRAERGPPGEDPHDSHEQLWLWRAEYRADRGGGVDSSQARVAGDLRVAGARFDMDNASIDKQWFVEICNNQRACCPRCTSASHRRS